MSTCPVCDSEADVVLRTERLDKSHQIGECPFANAEHHETGELTYIHEPQSVLGAVMGLLAR